ncbi:hypothetical protein MKW94_000750 [Papaver nudicaule]|uniref:DUF1308 domain-containing protein n=1 Tax=Papaver nudicaule TaxID=74823 RepID=A0AA42B2U9_PAPNU|nr:hypothetical protein [Papaver nudicaule]
MMNDKRKIQYLQMEGLEYNPNPNSSSSCSTGEVIEESKKRCEVVINQIQNLSPHSKITDSCKQTLVRLVQSELKFLNRLSASSNQSSSPISVNIGYVESIVHILQQPFINGVSRVCKPIPIASQHGQREDSFSKGVHVDIVCNLEKSPVWFIVSDRNPKYISWSGSHKNKGLRTRIEQILAEAQSASTLKPASIILFFANGLDGALYKKLGDEFGASELGVTFSLPNADFCDELEDDWVSVMARSYENACILQIQVNSTGKTAPMLDHGIRDQLLGDARSEFSECPTASILEDEFYYLISRMRLIYLDVESAGPDMLLGEDIINFDTTALIALVSGISNGCTEKLLAAPECEMRERFKSNYEFVIAQVMSELQNPIFAELRPLMSGKIGMICETVHSEFKELVSMCGGAKEKLRANQLLKHLSIVPDTPSARMMGLPTTRKIAAKNKVVFGTGDYWRAPTLTANMGFLRAISQTGMSLLTLEHRPRALTGD